MPVKSREIYFLVIIALVTTGFHLYDFGLPPLWPDETSPFIMSLSIISPHNLDLYHYSRQWGLHLGPFPVAWQHYNGNSIASFLSIPTLYFFGINLIGIRIYEMLIAIAVLVLTYFCGSELFSKKVGAISISLLTILPSFVFYSRQSALYDWPDLCISLLVIIFALRYLKTLKNRYLFGALFLLGIGVYEYLWFGWIVIGLLVTTPVWIKVIPKRLANKVREQHFQDGSDTILMHLRKAKIKFTIVCVISLVLGFSHIIAGYIINSKEALIPFVLRTITGNNPQYHLQASNTNLIENMIMRGHDLFDFLGRPDVGLLLSNVNLFWSDVSYVFPILFLITSSSLIIYIIYRKPQSKKIASLLLLILGIFVSSVFTVSELLPIQISIILPFVFLSMGKGIDILLSNEKILKFTHIFKKRVSPNYIVIIIIIIVTITQVPLLAKGFSVMESASTSHTDAVYAKLNSYIMDNHLKPVSTDFYTAKIIPFYSNGKIIPIVLPWTLPEIQGLDKFREPMTKIESLDLISKQYLFIIYSYPTPPDCNKPIDNSDQKAVCDAINYVENVAKNSNLKIEIIDFPLPDGTPFIRTMKLVDKS